MKAKSGERFERMRNDIKQIKNSRMKHSLSGAAMLRASVILRCLETLIKCES